MFAATMEHRDHQRHTIFTCPVALTKKYLRDFGRDRLIAALVSLLPSLADDVSTGRAARADRSNSAGSKLL